MQINIKILKSNIYKFISQIKTSSLNYRKKFGITICVLWILIILVIPFNLYFESQNFILVGLAALLASATVIKNIENTNKIEKEKIKRELFDRRKEVIFAIKDLRYILVNSKSLSNNILSKIIRDTLEKLANSEYIFEEKYNRNIQEIYKHLAVYKTLEEIEQLKGVDTLKISKFKTEGKEKLFTLSKNTIEELEESIKLV
ncbi:hypothetical protein [Aliarcobacter butzleri]|uniref:hypothetical protein n=1 Tax=Aliarcobacter butzleri TaxID=28197 RepID=UPI002447FE3D|nr:hypothetical protein [Aliarcobacter butzleri]MDH1975379.1 hypothetical protein [Aliarcobacter butzleri]